MTKKRESKPVKLPADILARTSRAFEALYSPAPSDEPLPTPVEPKAQVESATYKRIPSSPVCAKRGLWPYPCAGRIELQRDGSMKGAFLCEEHAFQAAQQAQVESVSVEETEEERETLKLIDERDAAEDAVGDIYAAVTGNQAEWSNLFGYSEAINEVHEVMQDLRSQSSKANAALCACIGPGQCLGTSPKFRCRSDVLAPYAVEPKEVESASVGAISDHEKGQKEEFYKFQQHLEKTQEEISKWPSWMREAGRASMGLGQREPKEVESGGLPPLDKRAELWIARDPQETYKAELYCRERQLKASLLREKELRELLRGAKGYMTGAGWQKFGKQIKAAVTGE